MRSVDLAWGFALVATVLVMAGVFLREPLSHVIASGDEASAAARDLLPVLGIGMAAQFGAVAWATIVSRRGHLTWAAVSLSAGALLGLAGFILLVPSADEAALAWATVIAPVTACLLMGLRTAGVRLRRLDLRRAAGALRLLVAENLAPLFSSVLYVLSVAIAAQVTDRAGEVSLFALAFLAASQICGILGWSSAIVDTVSLSGSRHALEAKLLRIVPAGVARSFPLAAGALAVGVVAGPQLVETVAPDRAGTADPELLALFVALLLPFTFATLALNIALSSWFTTGRVRELNRALVLLLPVHIGASALLGLVAGVPGVAIATVLAAGGLSSVALRPGARLRGIVARTALAATALALLAFAPAVLIGLAIASGLQAAAFATVAGGALFLALLWRGRRIPVPVQG
jgi:hypothetical protein